MLIKEFIYGQHLINSNIFRHFRKFFKVSGWEENGSCKDMDQFPEKGSGSRTLFWEQDWSRSYYCKLVNYQTQFSALVQGIHYLLIPLSFATWWRKFLLIIFDIKDVWNIKCLQFERSGDVKIRVCGKNSIPLVNIWDVLTLIYLIRGLYLFIHIFYVSVHHVIFYNYLMCWFVYHVWNSSLKFEA